MSESITIISLYMTNIKSNLFLFHNFISISEKKLCGISSRQVRPEMAPILLIYVMLVSSKSMYILDTSVSRIYLVWAEIDDYFIGFYL